MVALDEQTGRGSGSRAPGGSSCTCDVQSSDIHRRRPPCPATVDPNVVHRVRMATTTSATSPNRCRSPVTLDTPTPDEDGAPGVPIGVIPGVGVSVGVGVDVGVGDGVGVGVEGGVGVDVGVGVGVDVGVVVGVGVDVGVDVADTVDVEVGDGVGVGDGEPAAVGVGVAVAAGVPLPPVVPLWSDPPPAMLFVAMTIDRLCTEIVLSTINTTTRTGTVVMTPVGSMAVKGRSWPSVAAVSISPSQSRRSNPCSRSACSASFRWRVRSPSSGTQSGNTMLITHCVVVAFTTRHHKSAARACAMEDCWRQTMRSSTTAPHLSDADREGRPGRPWALDELSIDLRTGFDEGRRRVLIFK